MQPKNAHRRSKHRPGQGGQITAPSLASWKSRRGIRHRRKCASQSPRSAREVAPERRPRCNEKPVLTRLGWASPRTSSAPSPSKTTDRRKSGFTECDCADRLMGSCGASRAGLPTGPPWDQLPPFLPHVRGAGCPARCSCCCWLRRRAPFRTSASRTRPRTARTSSLTRERRASTVAGPARHALRAARASSTMTA